MLSVIQPLLQFQPDVFLLSSLVQHAQTHPVPYQCKFAGALRELGEAICCTVSAAIAVAQRQAPCRKRISCAAPDDLVISVCSQSKMSGVRIAGSCPLDQGARNRCRFSRQKKWRLSLQTEFIARAARNVGRARRRSERHQHRPRLQRPRNRVVRIRPPNRLPMAFSAGPKRPRHCFVYNRGARASATLPWSKTSQQWNTHCAKTTPAPHRSYPAKPR